MWHQFKLRTLFVIVTAISVYLAYTSYRLSAERYNQGEWLTGSTFNLPPTDAREVAKLVRERTSTLPGHTLTTEQLIELTPRRVGVGYEQMLDRPPVDQFFYKLKLSDGSESNVAFWVHDYPQQHETVVTYAVYAHDHQPDIVSGAAKKRDKERHAAVHSYRRLLGQIRLELKGEHLPYYEVLPDGTLRERKP